jgi:hypothetical protein
VLEAIMAETAAAQPMPTHVKATDFHATAVDGGDVLLRWYAKTNATTSRRPVFIFRWPADPPSSPGGVGCSTGAE